MFLQEVNEEAERKEKGRNNGWKESNEKAAMLRPALAGVAYRRLCVTLLGVYWGINRLIPWPVLQCVLAGHVWHSRHPPSTLSPATHTHYLTQHTITHTLSTDSSATQATSSAIPAFSKSRMSFPPGIKSQSKSGASERGGGEEERTAQTEPHLAASCSALCQIETEASCTLYRRVVL